MSKDYKRGLNDTDFKKGLDLLIRKVEVNDIDWQDIVDELGLDIHRDVLRKAFQAPFGGYAIHKYMEENKVNNSEDEVIKEYNEKIREFEIKKIQFQDQKREYRALLRADAKLQHIKETLIEEIHKINKQYPIQYKEIFMDTTSKTHAVLMLSDFHYGVEIDNYWNKFNKEVFDIRLTELLDKTIKYCKRHEVNTLHLELLGDLVNGYLHLTSRVENEENVIQQVTELSEKLGEFISELSKHIPNIKIYAGTGNHGRCTPNIKQSIATENFELLIPWYLQARLVNLDNIEFVKNKYDQDIIVYEFLNETIFSVHGHQDRIATVMNDLPKMIRRFPTEIHQGHIHHHYEKEEHDIEVVVNGTLSGTDDYAKGIRKHGTPFQKLMIYTEEGKECTYKIKLKG